MKPEPKTCPKCGYPTFYPGIDGLCPACQLERMQAERFTPATAEVEQ